MGAPIAIAYSYGVSQWFSGSLVHWLSETSLTQSLQSLEALDQLFCKSVQITLHRAELCHPPTLIESGLAVLYDTLFNNLPT